MSLNSNQTYGGKKRVLNDALRVLGKVVCQTSPVELYRSIRFVGDVDGVMTMATDGVEVVSVMGTLQVWENLFQIEIGNFSWYGKLLEGQYPNWRGIIRLRVVQFYRGLKRQRFDDNFRHSLRVVQFYRGVKLPPYKFTIWPPCTKRFNL